MSTDPQRLKMLFLAAAEIPSPLERGQFLDRECGPDAELRRHVEALLRAHDDPGSFLSPQAAESGATDDAASGQWVGPPGASRPAEGPGTRVGPYKLLQQIGEGGFGVVYMAEQQEPVRRKVALKIIKPGMDTREVIARFESERQALALMDHPNVARVFDAGATESGRPYFVMELVRGVPITEFCDRNRLPARERLQLFNDICHAVQHAHQKGIIHRDVKPSNILVTLHDGRPVPKVIDFGVAKATSQQLTLKTLFTAYGQMVGTPAYMSPEQAEMSGLDIDTRSDIYSLGVLLYELLTGTTPLEDKRLRQAGYAEMQRLIREEEPPRPSTRLTSLGGEATVLAGNRGTDVKRLAQLLRGDLDWIVMKALEKDRNRRYETPAAFAADVDRFLRNEAVLARPPSALYKLRKFTRRNRTAVLTAAVVVLLLLIGITGTSLGLVWAMRAEDEARHDEARAHEAEQLAAQRLIDVQQERDGANKARADAETAAGRLKVAVAQEDSRRLAAHGTAALPANPALALLLAAAGAEKSPARSASHNNVLLAALQECREERTLFAPPLPARAGRTARTWFTALQITPDGRRAVAAIIRSDSPGSPSDLALERTESACVYDLQTGKVTATLLLPHLCLGTMTISPDGRLLAAALAQGVECQFTDGQTVLYTDRAVRLWDLQTGEELRVLTGHTDRVVSLSFDAKGERLLTASWDRTARIWDVASGKTLHVLADSDTSLELAEFSPDGRRVLTASTSGMASSGLDNAEWLRSQRQPETALIDPPVRTEGMIRSIKPISVGSMSGGSSNPAPRLWDAGSGKLVAVLGEPKPESGRFGHQAAGFSPDGARAVTMGDEKLSLWDAEDGKHILDQGLARTSSEQSLADGDRRLRVVRTTGPGTGFGADQGPGLLIWQSDRNQQRWQHWPGARHRIRNAPWIDREAQRLLLDGSLDGAPLIAWASGDVVTISPAVGGNDVAVLRGHDDLVTAAAFLPEGKRIVTASADGTLRLWNLEPTRSPVVECKATKASALNHAVFLPGGRQVLTAPSRDMFSRFPSMSVSLWDAASGSLLGEPVNDTSLATSALHKQLLGALNDLDVSPDATHLVTVHLDSNPCADPKQEPQPSALYTPVRVWDLRTGNQLFTLQGLRRGVATARFSPDGRRIVTFSDGNRRYALLRDGNEVVGSGAGGALMPRVDLWDATTGKHVRSLVPEGPGGGHFALWSPDGRRILSSAALRAPGDAADILDAETGERLGTLKSDASGVDKAALSPDGKLVLGYRTMIYGGRETVEVWDAATCAKRFKLSGHTGDVTSAEFSQDSRLILTTSTDGTARLWDAATGEQRRVLRGHRHVVGAGQFSPDGKWVATASTDGTARIWGTETGVEWMTLPAAHGVEFVGVQFSPDSQRLLTASTDGTARIWPVDPLPLAVSRKPRELTDDERARFQVEKTP
jgi:WD40 repeat protein/serine/threonine protein kinase